VQGAARVPVREDARALRARRAVQTRQREVEASGAGHSVQGLEGYAGDDCPFIVLTETKFSSCCIPVWDLYSPYRTRV
jgi:hypothetical protein